jgi:hypothetical protein
MTEGALDPSTKLASWKVPTDDFRGSCMYRIEIARGEETVFRTIEELATAIRNGVVTNRARIYHSASQKWLPIEFHPHYKKALELPASSPSHPTEPTPIRPPTFLANTTRQAPPPPPSPAPAPVPHHSAPVQQPVQQQKRPVQHYQAPVPIPPPVPSPVLELMRPSPAPEPSRPAFVQPRFVEPETAVALEEPPSVPEPLEEPPPALPVDQPSRSWIRRPIQLTVIGAIAIVCTRVVVSAAAPGSESRPLAEAAPRPTMPQTRATPDSSATADTAPRPVLTAGPAFAPAIVTTAEAAKTPPAATAPKRPSAGPAAAADSIDAVDSVPTAMDLALPALPGSDSVPVSSNVRDSNAIGRILKAVTGAKPAPIKAAGQ